MSRPFATSMRIGDAEREAAVSALNRHFAEGRLTTVEHDERISLALAARTDTDLDKLFADLPPLDSPRPTHRRGVARQLLAMRGVPIPLILLGAAVTVFVLVHLLPILAFVAVAIVVRGTVMRMAFGARRDWHGPRGNRHGW
ncbi:MAG: hypothetical protein QOI42_1932 [Frankiaceae bacterium]|nr:hypothetical protein [Frankiaceae bacterium]